MPGRHVRGLSSAARHDIPLVARDRRIGLAIVGSNGLVLNDPVFGDELRPARSAAAIFYAAVILTDGLREFSYHDGTLRRSLGEIDLAAIARNAMFHREFLSMQEPFRSRLGEILWYFAGLSRRTR